jgi:cell pole-organizing protein PopZ
MYGEATAAVDTAFNTLAQTVKRHEPTLEDAVRETPRPMLKSWLDQHLPSLTNTVLRQFALATVASLN